MTLGKALNFWASDILIWGKEEGTVSELLAILFITQLRGRGKREWLLSTSRPVPGASLCPYVSGLSGLSYISRGPCSMFLVGLGRAHTALGRCTPSPLLTAGEGRGGGVCMGWGPEQSWLS